MIIDALSETRECLDALGKAQALTPARRLSASAALLLPATATNRASLLPAAFTTISSPPPAPAIITHPPHQPVAILLSQSRRGRDYICPRGAPFDLCSEPPVCARILATAENKQHPRDALVRSHWPARTHPRLINNFINPPAIGLYALLCCCYCYCYCSCCRRCS